MSVITYPVGLNIAKQSWGLFRNDIEFRSLFGVQALEASPPLWQTTLTAVDGLASLAGQWQSLMLSLQGRVNQLAMYNLGRPVPVGTMRGSITFSINHPAGTTICTLTAGSGQAGKTLKAGDYLGFGSGSTQQVVMVMADCTADGSGTITPTIFPAMRNAMTSGAGVTWNYPTALFRLRNPSPKWDYDSTMISGMNMDLLEDTRP